MTREEKIELLQGQIEHGRISSAELGAECEKNDIDLHDEVLSPIGWNTCERCGECGDSELDFLWVDYFPWDEDDKAVLKAIEIEDVDYCALCWDCVDELKKKGAKACGIE